jgi:primosomal protein N' (replication factor Y)
MDLARVALDVPLPTLFDYALPGADRTLIGRRVLVPFGRGTRAGVILEVGGAPAVAANRIRPVAHVFRDEPPLGADVLALLEFASRYYRHPIGQVVMSALPQMLRRAGKSDARPQWLRLTPAGQALDPSSIPARSAARRRLLERLRAEGSAPMTSLRDDSPSAPRHLRELIRAGLVESAPEPGAADTRVERPPVAAADEGHGPALTGDQQAAADAVRAALGGFVSFLLHGVTGSGKTEVYFEAMSEVLRRGGQVLMLVPEINLTPQLTARVRSRFPAAALATLHSNVAEGERLRGWRAAQSGQARVVIGTRLAVFTPMPRLGLIVVDEEHDGSFKQQEGLRYSARDLALLRGKQRGVPVVLGSATPSLESFAHAEAGRHSLLSLPVRPGAAMPVIRCVDTRGMRLRQGLSPALLAALEARLERGEQSLVFINRRGFSPALVCPACGWAASCTRCSARLTLHLNDACLRCHYCGHEEPVAAVCGHCGNQDLAPAGHGTQRIEHTLTQALPGARVLRVDRDSTRRKQAFERIQDRVHAQQVDILVGTQMLAKGHDFPRLTLVGVINADSALFSADFRASERLFALLTQVAGRAGRSELAGEVLIQTDFPHHPLYQAVAQQDYAAFARALLEERRGAGFPPFAHQALLRAEAAQRGLVDAFLSQAADAATTLDSEVEVFDPVPPPVERIAGRERAHLLVQARSRSALQRFLDGWCPKLNVPQARSVRWSLDVDPLDL